MNSLRISSPSSIMSHLKFQPLLPPRDFTKDVLVICGKENQYGTAGNIFHEAEKRGFRASMMVADHSQELDIKKIEESKTIIVVLPKPNPTFGNDLATLTTLIDQTKQLLLPFYYDAQPVLSEEGLFISSYFRGDGDTYEYQCIDNIFRKISEHIGMTIGLDPRVMEVSQLVQSEFTGKVPVVGIWGGPKIGKGTIAQAIHDLYAARGFDIHCFLGNIGENVRKHGEVYLPQMLLSKMVVNNCMESGNLENTIGKNHIMLGIGNFQEGMLVVKRTLNQKKVLLTLDGIDRADVLQAVVDVTRGFGSGSQVLLTAQEKCLFESQEIEKIYAVEGLDKTSARQLLCLNAFNSMDMNFKYMDIIHRAEVCASGNPLALKVIGSSFHGKSEVECESILHQYETVNADLIQYVITENNQIRLSEDILEENMDHVMADIELPKVMKAGCGVF